CRFTRNRSGGTTASSSIPIRSRSGARTIDRSPNGLQATPGAARSTSAVSSRRRETHVCSCSSSRCLSSAWRSASSARRRLLGNELLDALPVRVGGVHRALRVDDDAVDPVELARSQALLAPRREDLAVLELNLVHALERVIGDEPQAVGALPRDPDVPRIPSRVRELANVVQVLVEHFNAVAFTIDDVEVL